MKWAILGWGDVEEDEDAFEFDEEGEHAVLIGPYDSRAEARLAMQVAKDGDWNERGSSQVVRLIDPAAAGMSMEQIADELLEVADGSGD